MRFGGFLATSEKIKQLLKSICNSIINIYQLQATPIILSYVSAEGVDSRGARLRTIVPSSKSFLGTYPKKDRRSRIDCAFLCRVFVPLASSLTNVTRFRPVKLKADGAAQAANRNLLSRFQEPKSGKGHLAVRKCVLMTTHGQMVPQ